jgi:uncharacterized protein (DUF305 family)
MASGSAASGATPSSASTAKNDADLVFATMMIPHHAQAVVMADLALKQGTDPKVLALATKIKAAQSPEIERMSGWLKGWGEPVPATTGDSGMSGMSGMGDESGGMMSEQEMTKLGKATGSAFDRTWLQMTVKHHQGAVDMAKTALAQAANPDTKKPATSIIAGQSAEIAAMSSVLAGIPG